ncbi:hypothetical protein [Nocardia blacklockiae]|uniref:hypothetical protein n=1 Tax=Nocardia blacklockiae TaxID=480036 RepID=UPI0018943E4D|nr:hypothetical protein [Nocardia blacklockiae]MBF6174758.1 hypothetical protein [Nocardia blacklockiae]
MRRIHTGVDTVTAFLTTLVAGLSLALPIDFRWTSESSPLQLNLLAFSQPRAVAAGAIVAVVVATVLTAAESELASWCTTLGGIVTVAVVHQLGYTAGPSAPLTTLNFVDSVVGGILLGGVGAAVAGRRIPSCGWVLGMVASITVAEALPSTQRAGGEGAAWTATDSPPVWLVVAAIAMVIVSTYLNRRGQPAARLSVELPMAPIVAGLVLVTTDALTAEWVSRSGAGAVVVVTAIALAVLVFGGTALLLPGREGVFILMAVAVTAAGNAMVSATLPVWSLPWFIVLTAAGIAAGMRWRTPEAGFAATAAVAAVATLLAYLHTHSALVDNLGNFALAVVAGFALGAALPQRGSTRVIGLVLIVTPSAVLVLRTRLSYGSCSESPSPGGGLVCEFNGRASVIPGWAAVAVIASCAVFAAALRGRRVDNDTVGA